MLAMEQMVFFELTQHYCSGTISGFCGFLSIAIDLENHQKTKPSSKDLPGLPTSVYRAQKMGKGLGRSEVLQRPLPKP